MTPFQRNVAVRTRDPAFLARATILILAVFALSAALLSSARRPEELRTIGPGEIAAMPLPDDDGKLVQWARRVAMAEEESGADEWGGIGPGEWAGIARRLAALPDDRRAPVEKYLTAMRLDAGPAAIDAVLEIGRRDPTGPALTMAGDVLRFHGRYREALDAYERAAAAGGATDPKLQALRLCEARGWKDDAPRLLADPAWRKAFDGSDYRTQHDIALLTGDWWHLIRMNAAGLLHLHDDPDLLILTLLCGVIWFVCIHKGLGIAGRHWWAGGAGLLLGIASTALTLFFLSVQRGRDVWSPDEAQSGIAALLDHVTGTGLREETAKLLLFLPLALFLRGGTEARAMAAASCTGLGFAIEENLGYFSGIDGTIAWARFLSANFLHLSLTGLTGLAAFRLIRWPNRYAGEFAAVFVSAVVIHGLWNYSLTAAGPEVQPEIRDLPFLLTLGLAWFYFQTMRRCRDNGRNIVSPHGFFLLATAAMLGVILNFSVWQHGGADGTGLVLLPAIGSFSQAALFFWMLRDS